MDSLINDLTCPITLELFDDPVTVFCCGKSFSRLPLVQHLELGSRRCPACNGDLSAFNALAAQKNVVLAQMAETLRANSAGRPPAQASAAPNAPQPAPAVPAVPTPAPSDVWACSLSKVGQTAIAELRLSLNHASLAADPALFVAVVDRSGSMGGAPWRQVETALLHIVGLQRSSASTRLVIVAYDSTAASVSAEGPLDEVTARIRTMFTGGGTNFRAAFAQIREVLQQRRGEAHSAATIAFLTDGQDGSGARETLISDFREMLRSSWPHSVSVHVIGFGASCDRDLLEQMRLAGSVEGMFRYAEPTDDGDTLCHKLTGVFEVCSRAASVPLTLVPAGMVLLAGNSIQMPIDSLRYGEYVGWAQITDETVAPTLSVGGTVVPITLSPSSAAVQARWLARLADQLTAEVLEVHGLGLSPALRDLCCGLLLQRAAALGTGDAGLQARMQYLQQQIGALRQGTALQLSRLSDLRFASHFAALPKPSTAFQCAVARPVPVAAISSQPHNEHALRHYSRNSAAGLGRNALQDAIVTHTRPEPSPALVAAVAAATLDDVMHADTHGNTALMLAAYCGHSGVVRQIVTKFPALPLDAVNAHDESAATLAIKKRGFHHTLRTLLEAGATVPAGRKAALERFAIANGYVLTAEVISSDVNAAVDASMSSQYIQFAFQRAVDAGVQIDAQHYLRVALAKGMDDLARLLLEQHGAQPDLDMLLSSCIPPKPDSPDVAVFLARAAMVLDRQPALVHATNSNGESTVFVSAERGSLHHVQYFLSKGCAVDTANALGNTALWIACFKRYPCIIDELLRHGANVNHTNLKGNPPLYGICQRGPRKIAETLLSHGADLTISNSNGDTLLLLCCRNGQHELLELFLDRVEPALVDFPAKIDGFNCLFASVEADRPECIQALHRYGLSLEQRTDDANAILPAAGPLHLAAYYNRLEAARALLACGADVNARSGAGQTPLHVAVLQGNAAIVALLRQSGADAGITDAQGNTPLAYCRKEGPLREALVDPALAVLMRLACGDFCDADAAAACNILRTRCGVAGLRPAAACLDVADDSGLTPLHLSVMCGNHAVAAVLVALGASLRPDRYGLDAMFWAVHAHNPRLTDLLRPLPRPPSAIAASQRLADVVAAAPASTRPCFFLGRRPAAVEGSVSGDNGFQQRMCEFINVVVQASTTFALEADPTSVVAQLDAAPDFGQHARASMLVWLAKVAAISHTASDPAAPSASALLLLHLFSSNALVSHIVNTDIIEAGDHAPRLSLSRSLCRAVADLPPFSGEAFIGATGVQRAHYTVGSTVVWPHLVSSSARWRLAVEAAGDFPRRGTVLLVKGLSGRALQQYGAGQDGEVLFLPGSRFSVTRWYRADTIALGQANIREHTFKMSAEDMAGLGDKGVIIELTEVEAAV